MVKEGFFDWNLLEMLQWRQRRERRTYLSFNSWPLGAALKVFLSALSEMTAKL
jgi:hypothetical protein